jgi:hypothetical protein
MKSLKQPKLKDYEKVISVFGIFEFHLPFVL